MSLDLDFVRRQFPALAGEWVFFDNAGGSQTLRRVADRISDFLLTSNVQLGASYLPSQIAAERVATARADLARLVNAAAPEEIVMGPNSTVLFQFLARAMASQFRPGDQIIVTNSDHESNIGPWMGLRDRGVEVRVWPVDPETLELELDTLAGLMTDRTRLVCLTHASNILGTINPIGDIASFCHDRGARICVDAVAFAPHRAIDVRLWDVDYYVFSLYKVYGPHHAVLYGKKDLLLELDNIYHYFFDKSKVPGKLEPGNVNYELAWGSGGVVDYLEDLGRRGGGGERRGAITAAWDAIAAHEAALAERLLNYLRSRNDVTIIGRRGADAAERVPTISFTVQNRASDTIVGETDTHRIGIRYGDFYARRLIEDLGLSEQNGVVRVSMVHYNTLDEVDRLVAALDGII